MIRLLEENYRKMEQIIRVLSISDQWMTKKELAKEIGSSESTFIRYIEEIKIRWGTKVTIETSRKLGYRIEHFNAAIYLDVLMDMAQSSTNSQLLHEIIMNPGQTIEYYCEILSISRSSFTRKLKRCNEILESYLLKIIVDQGFQLTSQKSEIQLRIFVTFFFLNFYGRHELPYTIDKAVVKDIMERNHCQISLCGQGSTYEQSFYIMYFMVHLMRETQGFYLDHMPSKDLRNMHELKNKDYLLLKKELTNLNYDSYEKVIDYFTRSIFQQFSFSEQKDIRDKIQRNLQICVFSKTAEWDSDNLDFIVHLLTNIYFFSRLFPFDTTHLTYRATFFAEQIRVRHTPLYARLRAELQFFSTLLDTDFLNYLSSYVFLMLVINPDANQSLVTKRILVVSDLGIQHSRYVESYVSDVLAVHRVRSITDAITDEQLKSFDLTNYDLVVSNQPITNTQVPSLLIDDSISFSDEDDLINLFGL